MLGKGVDSDRQHQRIDQAADDKQADIARPAPCDLDRLASQRAHAFEENQRERGAEEYGLVQTLEFGHRSRLWLRRPDPAERTAGGGSRRETARGDRPTRAATTVDLLMPIAASAGAAPPVGKEPASDASCA